MKEAIEFGFCETVRVIFHGGEPLLIGKSRFVDLCTELRGAVPGESLEFCMQTNAILIDDEWIAIFQRFAVSIGVSIDGPQEVHDRYRLDHRGRPTHEKTVRGIRRLVLAAKEGRVSPPGALVVIQPEYDAGSVLSFMVHELEVRSMDFLLPDATWEAPPDSTLLGKYLCDLFESWVALGDPTVDVRILKSAVSLFLGGPSYLGGFGPIGSNAMTVLSNGAINGDDFLRPCGDHVIDLGLHISSTALADGFAANAARLSSLGATALPDDCAGCAFQNVCWGGQLTHRYSNARGFNNRSVYCEALKVFYERVLLFLYGSGIALRNIETVLRDVPRGPSESRPPDFFGCPIL